MSSRHMAYCSLEEAWGEKFASLYRRNDNLLVNMPTEEKDKSSDPFLQDRKIVSNKPIENIVETFVENINLNTYSPNSNAIGSDCKKFYQHFIECDKCREKIDKILSKNRIDDKSTDYLSGNPLLLILLLGVFLYYVTNVVIKVIKSK